MKILYFFFFTLIVFSCSNTSETDKRVDIKNNYSIIQDSIFQTYNNGNELSRIVFSSTPKKVVILSTPFYGYIKALNSENCIIGMLSKNRVPNVSSSIMSVGDDVEIDQEKIIALSPDLIICNSYQLKGIARLKSKYQVLVIDEFLETNPLKKASWIKFFGALFNKEKKSNTIYSKVKTNYVPFPELDVKIVQLNNYGGKWYLPGCKSYISQIIRDAGGKVDCDSDKSSSDVISEESAMVKLNQLKYLLFFDAAKDTLGLRIRLKPVLNLVKADTIKLLYCSTTNTNFFDKSILNPDKVLNELNVLITKGIDGEFFKLITLEN
jgi:iron complex transport system substrate-binding protein